MVLNMIALVLIAGISIIIPLIILGVIWVKHPMERKGIAILFLSGATIYIGMEWGVKEHGLSYLFNHTNFIDFMDEHYIPYLLLVAFAGAVLAMIPELMIVCFVFKKQISFSKAVALGLGYGMAESVMLVGYRSILTIVELVKHTETELNVTTVELFLSGYERILVVLIRIAIVVVFVYFIEQKMAVRGSVLKVFCHTLVSFLPGFFIAFSLENYYEVYDRSFALILVYGVLTMAAFCAAIVLNSMKYAFVDKSVDSPQAIAAYNRKMEEKKKR